jgi:hemin uptake protein HemP
MTPNVNAKPPIVRDPAVVSPGFPAAPAEAARPLSGSPGAVSAKLLFQGRHEVTIGHNGDTYRLRITRNGKLILTK